MGVSSSAAVQVVSLEFDEVPRWSYGSVSANFARAQILVTVYDGELDRYVDAVRQGLEDEADLAFLETIGRRLSQEPHLVRDISRLVGEFAARFGS